MTELTLIQSKQTVRRRCIEQARSFGRWSEESKSHQHSRRADKSSPRYGVKSLFAIFFPWSSWIQLDSYESFWTARNLTLFSSSISSSIQLSFWSFRSSCSFWPSSSFRPYRTLKINNRLISKSFNGFQKFGLPEKLGEAKFFQCTNVDH